MITAVLADEKWCSATALYYVLVIIVFYFADLNGMGRAGPPGGERKYKAYKLVVDPAMRQGPAKGYRFDGVGQPGVILQDETS